VAGIERRIEDLERHFTSETGGGGGGEGEELRRKFIYGALDAIAHIRRAPIDEPPWKYDVAKLREKSTFSVAQYVAALTARGHEDESQARDIFAEKVEEQDIDPAPFEKLTNLFINIVEESRRRREERKIHEQDEPLPQREALEGTHNTGGRSRWGG
jgi:hypothetical protein